MKTIRMLLLLLALALCLGCAACTDASEDAGSGEGSPTGVLETSFEKFDPNATAADIEFSYQMRDATTGEPIRKTTYHADEMISIDGTITNVSQKALTYMGTGEMEMTLLLYCETEDGEYAMPYVLLKTPSSQAAIPRERELAPGATHTETRYTFNSERNAPTGSYHLEVSVDGFYQTFYNVLTVIEAKGNMDEAVVEDFSFSYIEPQQTEYRRRDRIDLTGVVTNVCEQTYRYESCQHGTDVSVELFCLTEQGEYVLPLYTVVTDDMCRSYMRELAPGEAVRGSGQEQIPKDAPLGVYHLRICFQGLIGTVENVLIVVE